MSATVASVIAKARNLITDEGGVTWPDPVLLGWLNDGRRAIYLAHPELYPVTEEVTLGEGLQQSVPRSSPRLIDVIRNTSAKSRRAITRQTRDVMDRVAPARGSMKTSGEILHYVYDATTPREFEVYPPATAGTKVLVQYANEPDDIAMSASLDAEGALAMALVDFVAARAFQKEAEDVPAMTARADQHMGLFMAVVGVDQNANKERP